MPNARALALVLPLLAALVCAQTPPEPEDLAFRDGTATVPDRDTYERLAHQGNAGRDSYLNGIQFVKFILNGAGGTDPKLYFMNTKTWQAHPRFMGELGIGGFGRGRGRGEQPAQPGAGRQMRGAIAYRPRVEAPDGTPGTYTFDFQPNDRFSIELLEFCHARLLEKAPFLAGKLVYHPLNGDKRAAQDFAGAKFTVYLDAMLDTNIAFLPMNPGVTFGRLRRVTANELPTARDVVLYASLPNEVPRTAGMITGVRQTPLSHVNLRAIQDRVPNAYIAGAGSNPEILRLIGKNVCYTVRESGYQIREATSEEVTAHFANLRPAAPQTPPLDRSVMAVLPLDRIAFADAGAFGSKTANVAALRQLGLPAGMVPDGFGIPFHHYFAFLKHNGLDRRVAALATDAAIRADAARQQAALRELRELILTGKLPEWMTADLVDLQYEFADGTPLRCRSSTNNEDLPGFSGAGLYASCTHDPATGHLGESIKQIYASLWSDRAFEEREFHRVDHQKTAMGVLVHPNFQQERANGVAVTLDVLYGREGYNYLNAQIGEDMVTNPEAASIPEEVLLPWRRGSARLMQPSSRTVADERVLGDDHLETLKQALETIHEGFAKLYGRKSSDPRFAMEIEFKITRDDVLAIKQARPWIFAPEATGK